MPAGRTYPQELRDRAVRLVLEAKAEEPTVPMARIHARIGTMVGVNPDTLRGWVRRHRIDGGQLPGTTTDDRVRLIQLEREVKELKRANEILLAASSFFARELDPRHPW
jgi:transposase-like protein